MSVRPSTPGPTGPGVTDIGARIAAIRSRIDAAATACGRSPESVQLLAVSKTVPAATVLAAYEAGLRHFGENRAQELLAKATELPDDCRWHMIGGVQTNKVRMLASVVTLWHTVDRPALVDELERRAPGAAVLVEVNIGHEAQKAGCDPAVIDALVDHARTAGLDVRGLMCVPPAGEDPRPFFDALQQHARRLDLEELSMGMTSDFEIAVEYGATIVRVGTALFGPRPGIDAARN